MPTAGTSPCHSRINLAASNPRSARKSIPHGSDIEASLWKTEAWEKSQFKVPTPVFKALMIVTCIAILIQASFMLKSMTPQLIIFNVATLVVAFGWSFYRLGSGKAKPTVSYEMA